MNQPKSRQQKLGREGALLVLFGMDENGQDPAEALEIGRDTVREANEEIAEQWELVEWRVRGIYENLEEVDEAVQSVSPRWRVERMAIADRNILRIGAWELFESDIPPIVTINACVELGKSYGEESTPGFVNGLLDQLCKDHGIEVD